MSFTNRVMKKIRLGLLSRIIIAILSGVISGNLLSAPVVRTVVTFNALFGEFLGFSIPLIIIGLVTIAIADIGNKAGKLLLITVSIAYAATLLSGFISYFTGAALFPSMIDPGASLSEVTNAEGIRPYFNVAIPPLMSVMTALAFAFTLGLGYRNSYGFEYSLKNRKAGTYSVKTLRSKEYKSVQYCCYKSERTGIQK